MGNTEGFEFGIYLSFFVWFLRIYA